MKTVFLSFASTDLWRSLRRIESQAVAMGVYDAIIVADENSLAQDFRHRYRDRLVKGSRGFGYWAWKPQIILQTLADMTEGDILHYCDAGCHLNINGRTRLQEYIHLTKASSLGVLAFQATPPSHPLVYDGRALYNLTESKWTKGDLIDHLGVRSQADILQTQTIGATTFFIRKTAASTRLVEKWLAIIDHDFRLIDDTPSSTPNLPDFVEHRHDQSIFSILCKLNDVQKISAYEYKYPNANGDGTDWERLKEFPIHAKGDKKISRIDKLKRSLRKRGFKWD